jgi:hypothetical protein
MLAGLIKHWKKLKALLYRNIFNLEEVKKVAACAIHSLGRAQGWVSSPSFYA